MVQLSAAAQMFNVVSFGAVGNGTTMNTSAIQAAIDSCHNTGGGMVYFPSGNFLTSTLKIKSNVTIYIDSGATITGSANISDYPVINPQIKSYTDNYSQRSIFYAEGQHNIAFKGRGTVHGNGQSLTMLVDKDNRPFGFRIISCSNVTYDGLQLRHSGFWMMHNLDIDTLVIKNLNIINQNLGNGDGVNIDGCRHVLVDSIYADCNDDPVVIKATSGVAPVNGVEIRNCKVATYSRALKIGTETYGNISNVHVHDCEVFLSSAGPFPNTPAGCGINIASVNGSQLSNVVFENINMTGVKTPLFVRLGNRGMTYNPAVPIPSTGSVQSVTLRNITAVASSTNPSSVTGIPDYYAKEILLENIDIIAPGGFPAVSPNYAVPEKIYGKPDADMFGDTLPNSGIFVRHVDSIALKNICFQFIQPDMRPEIGLYDVPAFDTTNICGALATKIPQFANIAHYLSPNPVQSGFIVNGLKNSAPLAYTITNQFGQLAATGFIMHAGQYIDCRELKSGLYFFRIEGHTAIKLIKQ